MAGYESKIEFTLTFDGQQVAVTLTPLSYGDLLALRKDSEPEVIREYQQMLPRYAERLGPVLDAKGQPVPIDVICSAAYFAPLVAQILGRHLTAATEPTLPTSADQSGG